MTGVEPWLSGISTVGFPIMAYVMMWRLYSKTLKEQRDAFREQAQAFRSLKGEVNNDADN